MKQFQGLYSFSGDTEFKIPKLKDKNQSFMK